MQTADVIAIFRNEVATAQANKVEFVKLENLSELIEAVDQAARDTPEGVPLVDTELERYRFNLTNWQAEVQRDHESNLELLRASVQTGEMALKMALLINGGAAVAFLAFLGTAWASVSSVGAKALLAGAMFSFVKGVLAVGFAAAFGYICQIGFAGQLGKQSEKIGEVFRVFAILLVFWSFWEFYAGCSMTVDAFLGGGM